MADPRIIEEARRRREALMAAGKAGDTAAVEGISAVNTGVRNIAGAPTPDQMQLIRQNATGVPAANQENILGGRGTPPLDARAQAIVDAQNREQQTIPQRQEPTIATPENPVVRFGGKSDTGGPAPQNEQEMLESIAIKNYKKQPLSDDEVKFALNRELKNRQSSQPAIMPNQQPGETFEQYIARGKQETGDPNFQRYPTKEERTLEEFLLMTPEQQAVAASRLGFEGAQQIADMQKKGLDAQGNLLDERIQREQDRMAEEKAAAEEGNSGLLNEFKKSRNEEDQIAIEELQDAQGEEIQGIKGVFAGRGSSRQTATIKAIQKSSDNTKKRISEIERASGNAVSDYQVKLLDRLDQKMEKLQGRLDNAYDAKDDFKLQQIAAETKLATDLWSQNPSNPTKMMEVAQKISEIKIKEKKELKESIAKNFSFMTEYFGSDWLREMSPEGLKTYADNLDLPVETLANIGFTKAEQALEWDKAQYTGNQQFRLQEMLLGNEFEQQNLMTQFNNDLKKIGINHEFDIDLLDRKNVFDTNLATLEESMGDSKSLGAFGGIIDKLGGSSGYGGVAVGGDSNALSFSQGIPHPAVNIPVSSLNVALAQAYPDGFSFSKADGPGGLGGQCKWYSQLLTTLGGKKWSIGSTAAETQKNLDGYVKNGKAFYPGQGDALVGNTIITNDSKEYWHSAVINAIQELPNGKKRYVLTESNFKGPLTVSNSRIVDEDDPRIKGVLKTEPASKYKVPEKILDGIGAAAKGSGAEDLFGKITGIPALIKAFQGGVEGKMNNMVGAGKAEIEAANDPVNIINSDPFLSSIAAGTYKPTNEQMDMLTKKAPQALEYVNKAIQMGKESERISKGFTQDQSNAALFSSRMNQAEEEFTKLENEGINFADQKYIGGRFTPTDVLGIQLGGLGKPPELMRQEQAERNFINAVLRRESGASISPYEYSSTTKQYFPMPGDSTEVLTQKKKNRQLAIQGIKSASGGAYEQFFPQEGDVDSYINSL